MKILGIDPGSRKTGFGLIEILAPNQYTYHVSGVIETRSRDHLLTKIATLAFSIQEIIETYRPDEIAIEKVFINNNPAGSLVLGQARGAILAAIALKDIPITEYTALQIKKAVVGHGKSGKEQVQHMMVHLLKLTYTPKPDAADALAVALTHIFQIESKKIISVINY